MLILCGGDNWKKEKHENQSVKKLVDMFKESGRTISAICPNYTGKNNYIEKQCVRIDSFITANGTVTLEFSREIMKSLKLKTEEEIDNWYKFHKDGFYSE